MKLLTYTPTTQMTLSDALDRLVEIFLGEDDPIVDEAQALVSHINNWIDFPLTIDDLLSWRISRFNTNHQTTNTGDSYA